MSKKSILFSAFGIICLLLLTLSACSGPWLEEAGTITLSLGAGARAAEYPPTNENGLLPELTHLVTLNGPTGKQEHQFDKGKLGASFNVALGRWDIQVDAYLDGGHYAAGSAAVDVKARQNNQVSIQMQAVVLPVDSEYTIEFDLRGNESGDSVTASPSSGTAGAEVTINYTVADNKLNNLLVFGGVSGVAEVTSHGSGTRTYTINPEDADPSTGVITIIAIFEHTDLTPDPIAFEDETMYVEKLTTDASFIIAITSDYAGSGAIIYLSSDEDVATVDEYGEVTIKGTGTTVITAEKEADEIYAYSSASYLLTVTVPTCTVIFDTGDDGSDVDPITGIIPGGCIDKPEDPTRPGYTFDGWYEDEDLNILWDFDSGAVTDDMTLHAKWSANTAEIEITVEDLEDADVAAIPDELILSRSAASQITIAVQNGETYDGGIEWVYNGEILGTETSFTLNVDPAYSGHNYVYNFIGDHLLTVRAVKNGVPYTITIKFGVVS